MNEQHQPKNAFITKVKMFFVFFFLKLVNFVKTIRSDAYEIRYTSARNLLRQIKNKRHETHDIECFYARTTDQRASGDSVRVFMTRHANNTKK